VLGDHFYMLSFRVRMIEYGCDMALYGQRIERITKQKQGVRELLLYVSFMVRMIGHECDICPLMGLSWHCDISLSCR
jgi:hypothetical protein